MDLADIRCIIFDFFNTLSSTPYFWKLGSEFCDLATRAIFVGENRTRWASPWCCGKVSSTDIAEYLSGLSGLVPESILTSLNEGCAHLQLNRRIWDFAQVQRDRGRRTAIVSVNTDVFTQVVVPLHALDQVFDVIVNSADYGMEDKNALCEIAFRQLDGCTFENSLLIDDMPGYLDAFKKRGGMVYQYISDEAFNLAK